MDNRYNMRGIFRERIIRVLLNAPDGSLTKYRVAKEADVSTTWTIEFLRKLEVMGLVNGTKVLDINGLITFWSEITRKPKRFEFFHNNPEGILRSIKREYALTTYQAENLMNHYLFPSRIDIYIDEKDFNSWKLALFRGGLAGKGNIRLLLVDSHVFYGKQRIKGLWSVSLPQLLLDLKMEGGVALDAYEIMVKQYVRFNRNNHLKRASS